MAATTATFATNANQPRTVPDTASVEYVQWVGAAHISGASGTSATSPIHFKSCLIPHGATITEIGVLHRQDQTTASWGHNVGIAGGITSAVLFGSESFSSTIRYQNMMTAGSTGGSPYKVSISDDAAVRYVYPTVTSVATGTGSLSVSIGVYVRYTMNKTNAAAQ